LVKTWNQDRLELFDLSTDLEEAKDLSKSHPEKTKELHKLMVDFLNEVGAATEKTGSKAEVYETANPTTASNS
jgi:arylsulfatase A-like enzyme